MSRARDMFLGWTLAVVAMAVFAGLGAWQLGRMQQKQAMLDRVQRVLEERRPVSLALAGAAAQARGYDWAVGEGRFANAPAVLLDNQQRDGRSGVVAYRLFRPAGAHPLLVELGWLPLDGARTLPVVERPTDVSTVQGLLAPPPVHGIGEAVAVVQPDGTVLATGLGAAGLPAALGQAGLPPRVLKLDPALPFGHARDLDILPNTLPPERHLGYAVQWFALSLAVLVVAIVLTLRKARPRP
ncbi:SURF1 family protein [Luteimonas vadosa]|uniref:SURF1-like protein n=1 Tax=Luteimonas vadosa TaxID=1165507 RepID=A0ABP9DRM7_9GAMM